MTDLNRRHLGSIILAAGATAGLAGCGATASAIVSKAENISATVVTDVATLTNQFAIVKGIGQVALAALSVTDPAAAGIITDGITLIDGYVSAGTATVSANAAAVISTTTAILAAAAPVVSVIANAT
jgi:hypothetical protein